MSANESGPVIGGKIEPYTIVIMAPPAVDH
jgi:hypothetical protein